MEAASRAFKKGATALAATNKGSKTSLSLNLGMIKINAMKKIN